MPVPLIQASSSEFQFQRCGRCAYDVNRIRMWHCWSQNGGPARKMKWLYPVRSDRNHGRGRVLTYYPKIGRNFFFQTRTRLNESLSGKAWLGASSKSDKSNTSWLQLEGYLPRLEFRSCAFKPWIGPKKGFTEAGHRCIYSGSKPSLLFILGRIEWDLRNHGKFFL